MLNQLDGKLEIIPVFDEEFKMNNLVPEYKGMDMYEAREKIVERLSKKDIKLVEIQRSIGYSTRKSLCI